MKIRIITASFAFVLFLMLTSFLRFSPDPLTGDLTGEWKGSVQFKSGMFAEIKDLEFMRVFNSGGTMTESSNYDGAPPVPPAYGIWRKTDDLKYEAKYEFYTTNLPASFEELIRSGGFPPSGYGVITEIITLSDDGHSYSSVITIALFDKSGKQLSSDEADGIAERMEFNRK